MSNQNSTAVPLVNPRLFKELRLLWLPAAAAAVAAYLLPIFTIFEVKVAGEGIFSLLKSFAWLAFLGCILLIGSAPLGWEFQHRTMPMLLAQPFTRSRIWRDKMLAAGLWMLGLSVFVWVTHVLASKAFLPAASMITRDFFGGDPSVATGEFIKTDVAVLLLFVPATLCAAPLWTLTTRSTVGGMVFTVVSQFLVGVTASPISEKVHLHEGLAFVIAAVLYSLGLLWLGWRMFCVLQVTDGAALAGGDFDTLTAAGSTWGHKVRQSWAGRFIEAAWLDRAFLSSPTGATKNLFRKELRLQKPVYQVGAFFVLCWLVVFGLNLLQPGKGYDNLFDVLIAFYVPLVFLLAGSISISDENALGVSGWHLTLPVPAARQWTVKLVSSLAAGVAVGWVLPLVMLCITGLAKGYSTRWAVGEPGTFLVCTSMALFIMSLWAVSLVGNTVRAVMMALVGIVVLFFSFLLAHWWARTNGGFSARLVPALILFNEPYVLAACLLALASAALGQTLLVFRRPDVLSKPLIIYPAVLVVGTLLMGALIGELEAAKLRGYF